jgi:hypothetical protein
MTAETGKNRGSSSGAGTAGRAFLDEARSELADRLARIRHCVDQLDDAQVWWRPHEAMNSVANILLHLAGNLRQWIVDGVGERPDARDRPSEFSERSAIPKSELLRRLEATIVEADATLAGLDESRLLEPRRIQGFDETVLSATWDSLIHLGGHTQEIVTSPACNWATPTASPGHPRRPSRVPPPDTGWLGWLAFRRGRGAGRPVVGFPVGVPASAGLLGLKDRLMTVDEITGVQRDRRSAGALCRARRPFRPVRPAPTPHPDYFLNRHKPGLQQRASARAGVVSFLPDAYPSGSLAASHPSGIPSRPFAMTTIPPTIAPFVSLSPPAETADQSASA